MSVVPSLVRRPWQLLRDITAAASVVAAGEAVVFVVGATVSSGHPENGPQGGGGLPLWASKVLAALALILVSVIGVLIPFYLHRKGEQAATSGGEPEETRHRLRLKSSCLPALLVSLNCFACGALLGLGLLHLLPEAAVQLDTSGVYIELWTNGHPHRYNVAYVLAAAGLTLMLFADQLLGQGHSHGHHHEEGSCASDKRLRTAPGPAAASLPAAAGLPHQSHRQVQRRGSSANAAYSSDCDGSVEATTTTNEHEAGCPQRMQQQTQQQQQDILPCLVLHTRVHESASCQSVIDRTAALRPLCSAAAADRMQDATLRAQRGSAVTPAQVQQQQPQEQQQQLCKLGGGQMRGSGSGEFGGPIDGPCAAAVASTSSGSGPVALPAECKAAAPCSCAARNPEPCSSSGGCCRRKGLRCRAHSHSPDSELRIHYGASGEKCQGGDGSDGRSAPPIEGTAPAGDPSSGEEAADVSQLLQRSDLETSQQPPRGGSSQVALAAALGTHALLEAFVVGTTRSTSDVWIATLAILGHKGAEAVALASAFLNLGGSTYFNVSCMLAFVAATPVGIFIGSFFARGGLSVAGVLNALAVGVIFYACFEMMHSFSTKAAFCRRLLRCLAFLCGLSLLFGLDLLHAPICSGHSHGANGDRQGTGDPCHLHDDSAVSPHLHNHSEADAHDLHSHSHAGDDLHTDTSGSGTESLTGPSSAAPLPVSTSRHLQQKHQHGAKNRRNNSLPHDPLDLGFQEDSSFVSSPSSWLTVSSPPTLEGLPRPTPHHHHHHPKEHPQEASELPLPSPKISQKGVGGSGRGPEVKIDFDAQQVPKYRSSSSPPFGDTTPLLHGADAAALPPHLPPSRLRGLEATTPSQALRVGSP